MAFEPYGLLVLGHVLFASLWFGGGVYQVSVIGRGLMAAGPAGGGFVAALMRNGGIGKFFAISGALTILFGAILFGVESQGTVYNTFEPSSARGILLSLGALVAVLAYLHGLTANMPTEKKLIALVKELKGPPTKEQAEQMQALGMKLGKMGAIGVSMVGTAMLLMLLSRVFY